MKRSALPSLLSAKKAKQSNETPISIATNSQNENDKPKKSSMIVNTKHSSGNSEINKGDIQYFKVMQTKKSTKKHKTFDDGKLKSHRILCLHISTPIFEGILIIQNGICTLQDEQGNILTKSSTVSKKLLTEAAPGLSLSVGTYEVEVI